MRLGIYGGTFDPVHYGHLLLAECCRESCRLDQVWFVPAATPPHKLERSLAPGAQRAEMLELAVGGHAGFAVSRIELDHGGVSFTVDTLARLKAEDPAWELFFLMGADSLADFPTWKDPARICELSTPAVVRRAGAAPLDFEILESLVPASRIAEMVRQQVEMPLIGLSSSDIRWRVAQGLSIRYRTPRAVEKYIETQGLYQSPS